RRQNKSESNSVRDVLKSVEHDFLVDCVDTNLQFIVANGVENLVDARRQSFDKLLHIDGPGEERARLKALEHLPGHDVHGFAADNLIGIEGWIEHVDYAIEVHHLLGNHRVFW